MDLILYKVCFRVPGLIWDRKYTFIVLSEDAVTARRKVQAEFEDTYYLDLIEMHISRVDGVVIQGRMKRVFTF